MGVDHLDLLHKQFPELFAAKELPENWDDDLIMVSVPHVELIRETEGVTITGEPRIWPKHAEPETLDELDFTSQQSKLNPLDLTHCDLVFGPVVKFGGPGRFARQPHCHDETYSKALAEIVNYHHRQPFAAHSGEGTTSSSDGQQFRAGGRGEQAGQVNLA